MPVWSDCNKRLFFGWVGMAAYVAVVYSTGKDLNSGGADEDENLDGDNEFVSHDIQANGSNGEFDHRLVWISPYVLYNAMIQAGQLP